MRARGTICRDGVNLFRAAFGIYRNLVYICKKNRKTYGKERITE